MPVNGGSQYTSIALTETLVLEGMAASIGSIGDAYDNALAETTIGLFKTEAVGRGSPFLAGPLRTIDDVEYATMEWVDSTSAACTANSTTSHPMSMKPPTTLKPRRPSRRRLNYEAGIKPRRFIQEWPDDQGFRIPEAQARPVAAGVRRLLRAPPRTTRAEQGIRANGLQAQLHPAWGRLQHGRS